MKKNILILGFCVLFNACQFKNSNMSDNEYAPVFSVLNQERTYYLQNNDSVRVHPFQLFNIVEFKDIENGMFESLIFSVQDSIQDCKVSFQRNFYKNSSDNLSFSNESFKNFDNNNSIKVRLKTRNGDLIRTFRKNQKYKILYYYDIDSTVYRTNYGTDDFIEGMQIIDIVPLTEKFKKDENF